MNSRLSDRDQREWAGTSPATVEADRLLQKQGVFAPPESERTEARSDTSSWEIVPGMLPPTSAGSPPEALRARRWLRQPWSYLLLVLVLLLALAGGIGGGVIGARLVPVQSTGTSAQTVTLSASVADLQQAVENVSQGVQPSVAEVTSRGPYAEAVASGVILTKDGYIATNDHVVSGFRTYIVTLSDGTELSAHLVGEAAQEDLAVLKVSASNLAPITFADSSTLKVGQFVVALGAPIGLENSATFGIVSALNRTASDSSDRQPVELSGLIQTNATINPGNSGGALLDLQGRLIGMPTLRVSSTSDGTDIEGVSFAITANRIKSVTTQLMP